MTVGRPSGSLTVVTYPFGLCSRKYSSRSRLFSGAPSTQITSRSGSAFVPCSTTTFPLSVTRPAAMISSALRRDATPQAAIIFCSLSEAMVKPTLVGNVGCLGEILSRYQQKLILGASNTILAVGPVLFAFIATHRGISGRPFDEHKNLQWLSLTLDLLAFCRAC